MNASEARAALQAAFSRSFKLVHHPITEKPDDPAHKVAYVGFPGSTVFKVARWRDGEWRDHRGRSFEQAPDRWFSVEPRK